MINHKASIILVLTLLITLPALLSINAGSVHDKATTKKSDIDPIVPFRFFFEEEEKMIAQMVDMKEKYSLRRFLLVAPTDEIKLQGYPSHELFEDLGKQILSVKNRLKQHDIEIGWWCAPSLRMGPDAPFQYITDITGVVANSTPCPLDPNFKKDFSEKIGIVAKIANPFKIQFEDDFEISWHPFHASFGCFCPLHLAKFSELQGKNYTREELKSIFRNVNPTSMQLRKAWSEMAKNTLVDFAAAIRAKVDEANPSISITLCQSGAADFDGNFTEDVTQALAGSTQPSVRLYGAGYSVDKLTSIPELLFHALYCKQHLPNNFELLHESDTYPHNRYFTSANMMKSLLTGALSIGLDDFLFYVTQYLDNPLEEKAYAAMYKEEIDRLSVLKENVKNNEIVGCEILYHPMAHITNAYKSEEPHALWNTIYNNAWVPIVGRYGIPYTSKNGNVKLVSGNILEMMSDDEIRELLKGALFLDGVAAKSLYNRGFGELIGVKDIQLGTKANFCFEGIRNPKQYNIEGKLMYNLIFAPAGSEIGGGFYQIKPMETVEVITDFLDPYKQPVIPGLISFENKLGGRIAITSFDLSNNESSTIFNYRKKELIRQTIHWLGKEQLPVCVLNQPNLFCIFSQSEQKEYGILTLFNMTADIHDSVEVALADEWTDVKVEVLQKDGKWEIVKLVDRKNIKEIQTLIAPLSPVIIKLTKS